MDSMDFPKIKIRSTDEFKLEVFNSGSDSFGIIKCPLEAINDLKDYWHKISHASSTLKAGLNLTFRHLKAARNSRDPLYPDAPNYFDQQNGISTIQLHPYY